MSAIYGFPLSQTAVLCSLTYWRVQALDELDVEEFRHGGANITGFRLVNTTSVLSKRAAAGAGADQPRWQSDNPRRTSSTTLSVSVASSLRIVMPPPRRVRSGDAAMLRYVGLSVCLIPFLILFRSLDGGMRALPLQMRSIKGSVVGCACVQMLLAGGGRGA